MSDRNYYFMTRRIDSTTYRVKIYLDENGTETMENKLFRIILNHPVTDEQQKGLIL